MPYTSYGVIDADSMCLINHGSRNTAELAGTICINLKERMRFSLWFCCLASLIGAWLRSIFKLRELLLLPNHSLWLAISLSLLHDIILTSESTVKYAGILWGYNQHIDSKSSEGPQQSATCFDSYLDTDSVRFIFDKRLHTTFMTAYRVST